MQAIPDGRLLVLERGLTAGVGNTVRLYPADPRRATKTGGIEYLTGQEGVRLIEKTLLTDIVTCLSQGATAGQPPAAAADRPPPQLSRRDEIRFISRW